MHECSVLLLPSAVHKQTSGAPSKRKEDTAVVEGVKMLFSAELMVRMFSEREEGKRPRPLSFQQGGATAFEVGTLTAAKAEPRPDLDLHQPGF